MLEKNSNTSLKKAIADKKNKKSKESFLKKIFIKIKSKKLLITIKIILIVVFILNILFFVFYKADTISNFSKKEKQKLENSKQEELYNVLKSDKEFYLKTFQSLLTSTKNLEKEIDFNRNYARTLDTKINELESKLKQINIDPKRTELIKLALAIKFDISSNFDYSKDLLIFKMLSNNNSALLKKINILNLQKNSNINYQEITKTFKEEMDIFLKNYNTLKNNKNKIINFLSNFITFRKIKNVEKNTSSSFILELEKAINSKNYIEAKNLIDSNLEYSNYFTKTNNYLSVKISLNNAIEEIINYLLNNK